MQRPKSPNFFYLSPSSEVKEALNSSNQPIRDILLLKCKATIEELQQEIESLQRSKAYLEEKCSKNEGEILENEKNLKEANYLREKAEDDADETKSKLVALAERTAYFEEKMRFFQENDLKNQELKENFEELCLANENLKEKLEEKQAETMRHENFVKEWQETITSLNTNLTNLNYENKNLKTDNESLTTRLREFEKMVETCESYRQAFEKKSFEVDQFKMETDRKGEQIISLKNELQNTLKEQEKLRKNLEALDYDYKNETVEREKSFRSKLNETETQLKERYSSETQQIKTDMLKSLEKMHELKEKSDNELEKLRREKESLKAEIRIFSEKNERLESELKDQNEKTSKKFLEKENSHKEESRKSEKIIEDQNEIILKMENLINNERYKNQKLERELEIQKAVVVEAGKKNEYLTKKLQDSQYEIESIQKEIRRNFANEDEKQVFFHKKIRELEVQLREKDLKMEEFVKENAKIKQINKKQKQDNSLLQAEITSKNDENLKNFEKYHELIKENEELSLKNNDMQAILTQRLEENTLEIKSERENRLQEQKYSQELEEKLVLLESQHKSEVGFLKAELLRKERECEKLRLKHDDYNFNLMNTNINQPSSREQIYEKPEKDLRELKSHLDHFETELYKDKIKHKMNEEKTENRNVVGRFKGIIGKLEEKLNRMSAELKLSESFH